MEIFAIDIFQKYGQTCKNEGQPTVDKAECLQKVHEHFCSIYRPNIDPHFEKYVANIDQNHKVSEKYEHGQNLAKIKQENDLQAGKMSRFYR